MKKLLALALSVMMAASLAVPAFAEDPAPADGDPGFWVEAPVYQLGDVIPIHAILDGDPGIIGGADGPTEIIVSPDDILDPDFTWWAEEEEYLDAHPGLREELRANAYDYFAQEYPWYESAREYMELREMSEEEFLDEMVLMQATDLVWAERQQAYLDAQKEMLGGVPGQIGVMVNGKYIQFADAAPEITEGRTMVPVRALVEALGGKAEQTDGKVVCKTDEIRLTFTPGSAEVLAEYPGGELPGDGQIFPLDCAPYVKDGRTYVPVRSIGEILGYTVGWDSAFETVVLLDAEALAAEIDADFTIYNKVLANVARDFEEGKSYSAELKLDASLTAFDTLNGNADYTASLAGEELFDSNAANGSYTLTMSDGLAGLLVDALISQGMPEEEIEPLRAALDKIELSYIMTREGLLWAHSPLLDQYGGEENIWIGLAGDADAAAASFDNLKGSATVGTAYAAMLDPDSVYSGLNVSGTVEAAKAMLGDGCFTTKNGVSTLKWDVDKLIAKALEAHPEEELDEAELKELKDEISKTFKEFDLTLTVDKQGNAELSCLIHTLPQSLGDPSVRAELECSLSTGKASMELDLHAANIAQLKMTLDVTRKAASEKPEDQPPEGANVLEPAELLNH